MHKNLKADFYPVIVGSNGTYSTATIGSPISLNPTNFARAPPQSSFDSTSRHFVKPSTTRLDRSFLRPSIKRVYNETQGPTTSDTSWHSRSSSEHSFLSQNSRPQVDFDDSPTVFPSPASTLSPQQADHSWTPEAYTNEARSEPIKRKTFLPKTQFEGVCVPTTAGNMYSQLSAMTNLPSRGSRNQVGNMACPRHDSNVASSKTTFQMYVNGVKQPGLSTDSNTIKYRLLENHQLNRQMKVETTGPANPPTPNANIWTWRTAENGGGTLDRHLREIKRHRNGANRISSRPTYSCMTQSVYNDRIMDYGGSSTMTSRSIMGGDRYNDYPSGSISAMTSPTVRSVGHAGSSLIIEELQDRFQNSTKSKGTRPILKHATASMEYMTPTYQRNAAPTVIAVQASRPHHQSELTLPTATAASFEQPSRSINTASTVRLNSSRSGNLRVADAVTCRGGPSFRRLQTLYGNTISQKRYSSDNALDMTYLEEKLQPTSLMPHFGISNQKAGTVKIQVRSRSEHTSPTNEPSTSPRQTLAFASSRSRGGSFTLDSRIRPGQGLLPIPSQASIKDQSTCSSADRPQNENEENLVLPSVRDIIRQVEEMTLKNNNSAHNSTTSLSRLDLHQPTGGGSGQHLSRTLIRSTRTDQYTSGTNRSQSTSSIPINGYGPPRLANFDGTSQASGTNSGDFHPDASSKGHSLTRREDLDSDGPKTANSALHVARKGEHLVNLPQDYQKLLEAFLEQRKEIQRLRKEMVDKDRLIASLQKDIHMYEPWR